jgi:hypothetical protein
MRKNVIVLSSLVIMISMALISPVLAVVTVSTALWLSPLFKGTDSFYGGGAIIAYRTGSTAKLALTVDHNDIARANISAVKVWFDWGVNYTSTEVSESSPIQLNTTTPRSVFNVEFAVPATTVASNLFKHSYVIYIEQVNATTGPTRIVATYTSGTYTDFVVYSSDQADARDLNQRVDLYSEPTDGFSSAEAQVLWQKGLDEASRGDTFYSVAEFASAKTSYQNAITLYEEAYTAEETFSQDNREAQTSYNNALAGYYNALADSTSTQANATMKEADASMTQADAASTQADAALRQADAALTNAYGWMSIGIGWVLIGVGAIIYGLRKPKAPS